MFDERKKKVECYENIFKMCGWYSDINKSRTIGTVSVTGINLRRWI